ncbi:MAG: hypothetical protein GX442_06165 [Candidatus Riflebacteria bacterium]|nr:hypothetical protein [Candidatus Riflebacteria bacterium]
MNPRSMLVAILLVSAIVLTGCGGGGGGDSPAPTGPTTTPVTLNGTVTAPEINDGLLGSTRGAAAGAIDFSKLTIQAEGYGSEKALSGIGAATFTLTIDTLTGTTTRLLVRNRAGTLLMARRLEGLTQGLTKDGVTVDATSTAIVALMGADSRFSLADLEAQATQATFQAFMASLTAFLKDATSGSPLDDTGLKAQATTAGSQLRPGQSEITAAYESLRKALEDTTLADETRLQTFMAAISPDFLDMAGTPSYADLESVTRSRFDRYTINAYSFTATAFTWQASDTIKVTTEMKITVTLKPGKTGSFTSATVPKTSDVIWKWSPTAAKWLIQQGLPYKTDDLNI